MLLITKCSSVAFCFSSFWRTFPVNCLYHVVSRMGTSTLFQRRVVLVWKVLQPETLLHLGRARLFLVVTLVL